MKIPYHVDIMERLHGIDLDSARRTSGNGFYYLCGDIARLHSAILSYPRDFMIDRGFTYYVPPFMIRSSVVNGVMSFAEMENMMYKIEGEDLYLIGTSEHSMIGKFIDTILDESQLHRLWPATPYASEKKLVHTASKKEAFTASISLRNRKWSLSPQTRGKHGMVQETVDQHCWLLPFSLIFQSRTLECCSGDLADLKVKSLWRRSMEPTSAEILWGLAAALI